MAREYHLHLISDSTGETLNTVANAVCAQFEDAEPREHVYALVRSERQLRRVVDQIGHQPGIVFFTIVNPELRAMLESECRRLNMPFVSILDRPIETLGQFLGAEESHRPGTQHEIDSRYMERVEALNFAIQHDDGHNTHDLGEAHVILVGVSRTSKTPTCVYLASRGVRAANIPVVPGVDLPEQLFRLEKPLIVGLWATTDRLVQVRRIRLGTIGETKASGYVDEEIVRNEVAAARRLFERNEWPSLDVSRRSIEETAAEILNLLAERERP